MTKDILQSLDKPVVQQYADNEWEFIYPPSIDNEKVYNEY